MMQAQIGGRPAATPRLAVMIGAVLLSCSLLAMSPSRGAAVCGDGVVTGGEECDPGGPTFNDSPAGEVCTTTADCSDGGSCENGHCRCTSNGECDTNVCATGLDGFGHCTCTTGSSCFYSGSGGCCKFNCQAVGSGNACDDGNACSLGEQCNNIGECTCAGSCDPLAGVGDVCRPAVSDCDATEVCLEGIGCPADGVSPAGTVCRAAGGECDPAETCTGGSPVCPGESNPNGTPCTDDGSVCTDDLCDGGGACLHPNNSAPCSDDIFCNGTDTCSGGSCSLHVGNPCPSQPECNNGTCNEAADDCAVTAGTACSSDSNVCTDDQCDGSGSCAHVNNTAPCSDGAFCTGADTCAGGSCSVHAGDPCAGGAECNNICNESSDNCLVANGTGCSSDSNVCTDDQCDGLGGCGHLNNDAPCSDGLFCTGADSCGGGSCSVHVGDPCAGGVECNNVCNEAASNCALASGTGCSDDGNVCTDDQCNGVGGCTHPDNTDPCSDSLYCTVNDVCAGGACGGAARDCDDSNSCTSDTCNETGDACANDFTAGVGTPCDDASTCTLDTVCVSGGSCAGGSPLDCDDSVDCTTDSCQAITGCSHIAFSDVRTCGQGCFDGIDNEGDGDIDFESPSCSTLALVQRFAVVATHDTGRKSVYSGSDVTVGGVDSDGVCDIGSGLCECVTPGPVACRSLDSACSTDSDCRTAVAGTCNLSLNQCECPAHAPNCQALERPCLSDAECAIAPYPYDDSNGGVCGYSMEVRAGTHFGLLESKGKLSFGKGTSNERHIDVQREIGTNGGQIVTKSSAPLVGAQVCSSDLDLLCDETITCPPAPGDLCVLGNCSLHQESCLIDADCAPACDARRRLDDGQCSNNPALACTLDSACGGGNSCDHPFVFTDATTETWQRCDDVLQATIDESSVSEPLKDIADAVAAYVPGPGEAVAFPGSCEACPMVETPDGDPSCVICPLPDQIKSNAELHKFTITVGGGLQILDLVRVKLSGGTELHLNGQEDTVLVVRLSRGLRLGGSAKVVLGSNGGPGALHAGSLLWNFVGKSGGQPALSRDSRFFGTIFAPERPGIRTGSGSVVEGAVMSRKVQLKQTTIINHVPFTPLLPVTP